MTTEHLEQAVDVALRTLDIESQAVLKLRDSLGGSLSAAMSLLNQTAGKVIVSGLGKSGHIGAKIAATLASTGTPAQFVHSAEALHGDSGMVSPQDSAILISNSGATVEVCAFAKMLVERQIPLVALTAKADSLLASLAHVTLSIAVEREADPLNLAPTASTTVTLALGDALASGLMILNGTTPQDFLRNHPGGALGHLLSQPQEQAAVER